MESLAIIPARGGSKRIPGKNIKEFHGAPIISYSIRAAIESQCFNEVMVSTDNREIAAISRDYGAVVPFMRSEKTSDDFATTADVIEEVLDQYQKLGRNFRHLCCIYPAAPFITAKLLQKSFQKYSNSSFDALMPVVKFSSPIWRSLRLAQSSGCLEFMWPEFAEKRSQDCEPAYHDAGQFYWCNVASFRANRSLLGQRTAPFELDDRSVQDIDTQDDWEIAELKFARLNRHVP